MERFYDGKNPILKVGEIGRIFQSFSASAFSQGQLLLKN